MSVFVERVNFVFYRYGRFCASHSASLLIWSIFTFSLLCQPVLKLSFLNTTSFEALLSPILRGHVPDTTAGYVIQVFGTLKHSASSQVVTADNVVSANCEIQNAVLATHVMTPEGKTVGPLTKYCRTLIQEANAYIKSSPQPPCLLVVGSDLSRADIQRGIADTGGWWPSFPGFSATVKSAPDLFDVANNIIFERLRLFSRTPEKFSSQFSAAIVLRATPMDALLTALCDKLSEHLTISGCARSLYDNEQVVTIRYQKVTNLNLAIIHRFPLFTQRNLSI